MLREAQRCGDPIEKTITAAPSDSDGVFYGSALRPIQQSARGTSTPDTQHAPEVTAHEKDEPHAVGSLPTQPMQPTRSSLTAQTTQPDLPNPMSVECIDMGVAHDLTNIADPSNDGAKQEEVGAFCAKQERTGACSKGRPRFRFDSQIHEESRLSRSCGVDQTMAVPYQFKRMPAFGAGRLVRYSLS
jgi:hypothetical protein